MRQLLAIRLDLCAQCTLEEHLLMHAPNQYFWKRAATFLHNLTYLNVTVQVGGIRIAYDKTTKLRGFAKYYMQKTRIKSYW